MREATSPRRALSLLHQLKAFHIMLSLNKVVKEHMLEQNSENVI